MPIATAWFGPYKVASSTLGLTPEMDYADPVRRTDILTGESGYISEYLQSPSDSFHFSVKVPSMPLHFPVTAAQSLDYCGVVYFPTNNAQNKADYLFHPQGFKLPLMLSPGDRPAVLEGRHPLILFSHGYQSEFMVHTTLIRILASHGFIVAAVFHGDRRVGEDDIAGRDEASPVRLERLLLRGLSLKAALDTLETGPFGDAIDWGRVGGLGISFGGASLMLLNGAPLNVTDYDHSLFKEDRLRCSAAQVPYMGSERFKLWDAHSPAWAQVNTPWLAVSGTRDSLAPIAQARQSLEHIPQDSWLATLEGEEHFMSARALRAADSWILEFFKRQLLSGSEGPTGFQNGERVDSEIDNHLEIIHGRA